MNKRILELADDLALLGVEDDEGSYLSGFGSGTPKLQALLRAYAALAEACEADYQAGVITQSTNAALAKLLKENGRG